MYSSIVNSLMGLSDGTKINYLVKSKKCEKLGINILEDTEKEILNKIKNLQGEKRNCIMEYINICIVIRRNQGIPYELLISHRNDMRKVMRDIQTETNEKLLREIMPKVVDLVDFGNEQYTKENYVSYVVNYLVLNFNCRVMDLDLFITRGGADNENNFLVLENNKATFVRNKYKTKKTYGVKKNVITDYKIIRSLEQILGANEKVKLINKDKITSHSVKNNLYNNICPSKYFKIVVAETDKNELFRLSKNRGTSLETILRNYNTGTIFN